MKSVTTPCLTEGIRLTAGDKVRRKRTGETVKQLAEEYGLRIDSMQRILSGKRYSHVPMP